MTRVEIIFGARQTANKELYVITWYTFTSYHTCIIIYHKEVIKNTTNETTQLNTKHNRFVCFNSYVLVFGSDMENEN